MKKLLILSILVFFFCGYSVSPSFSQKSEKTSFGSAHYPYAYEEEWIEVMFSAESKVRMRNGNLVDLATQALQGVEDILNDMNWHQWQRLTDVPESTIDNWEINGERNTGTDIYNLNNIYRLKIPEGSDTWSIAERLEALPGVYLARPVPKPMALPSPPPGSFQTQQGYLYPATNVPSGVDALYAWTQTGGTGTGVTICDLEYSWNYNHADITKAFGSQINTGLITDPFNDNNHGTAVIGELVADNNGWGTTGICYGSSLKTCATNYNGGWNVPGAIMIATSALSAGDIILIEQQWQYSGTTGYVPIEWWLNYSPSPQSNNAVYAAIVNAVANGIHVVEAGGNGDLNTGTMTWYGNSGAIIVGAGGATTTTNLKRIVPGTWGSSYGPRFDLQGWGENVFTTGYGTFYSLEGPNYYYRADFNGTSSASPIVAGALACAEGYYLANVSSIPPTPAYMRSHLATFGTAQVFPPTGNIGPRPNIKNAILNFPLISYDFGDAPDGPYPTLLASNGARHTNTGLRMGGLIDSEANGQPNGTATGDDNNPPAADDEDGVTFTSALTPGQMATVQVTVSAPGVLNAWIDFSKVNAWAEANEFIIQNFPVIAGMNVFTFQVPATALPLFTYARFRLSTQVGLPYYGAAPNGEVEDHQVFIEEVLLYDFGDAPAPLYPTLLANNGARHINTGLRLGALIDLEPDGQPDPLAMGDDNNPAGIDDEDGVWWSCNFTPGHVNTVKVNASGQGSLNAWFDFNMDGDWADPGEQVFTNVILQAGVTDLYVSVPANALLGTTFARFRFSSTVNLSYFGLAPDGEVEDYSIIIQPEEPMDYGDAPDPSYPTLAASNGARHANMPALPVFLGNLIDWELNGQPSPNANGDDLNMMQDEDGVLLNTPLIPGLQAMITVTASIGGGTLQAWIDFNQDGDWMDQGEQILTNMVLVAGQQVLNFIVPPTAALGNTYARYRYSTMANLMPYGCAPNGEVEDYMVYVGEFDMGDAPDPSYPTLLVSNGAMHKKTALFMGVLIDSEPDGQPNGNATGDDINPAGFNDEDGVWWPCNFTPGQVNTVKVSATGPGLFQGWIDYNMDGDWADPGEQVFTNVALPAGTTDLFVSVPGNANPGTTFARFRFSSLPGLTYTGPAPDGEVEDYSITVQPEEQMDYGDAPDPTYPTLAASNGARHANNPLFLPIWLGNLIDWEFDGQPGPNANGDDLNMQPDEDGVVQNTLLIPGMPAALTVTASIGGGALQGWIDFNHDGDWMDQGEQIFNNFILAAGPQPLNFVVPPTALLGNTFARYRYSTMGNLMPYGCAPNGEVEDYQVFIGQPPEYDFGDAPDPSYPTLLTSNGANHLIANNTYLGALVDAEPNGIPSPGAVGDDLTSLDDEEGVIFMWPMAKGNPCKLKVTASVGDALFNGWIDFNGNGSWAEPNEHVFVDLNLLAGVNYLNFITPRNAVAGPTYARFRFSHQPALSYTGQAFDGEVEDYAVETIEYTDIKWQQDPDPLLPGMHVNETTMIADDWICNGEVVTDLHWWGNYEMGPGGIEKRGAGINSFLLHIYSNATCLPNSVLKTYVVPFNPGLEINTGLLNNEGSPIYQYNFQLPEPFIQVRDTTYWLTIQAISNDMANPPSWRWQEANRWLFPIHCGAAQNPGPTWQTITWPFPPLIKYSDFAFQITSWRVDTLYLQNINVTNGQTLCYDANLVIIVAGGGNTFNVFSGGSATMIAGQKISYLPGTKVYPGGYMLGKITMTGQYCNYMSYPIVANTLPEPDMMAVNEPVQIGTSFRAYPNPTDGKLILELTNTMERSTAIVEVYGFMGTRLLREEFPPQAKYEVSLALQPPGIYIVRIITGKETRTVKVIRN